MTMKTTNYFQILINIGACAYRLEIVLPVNVQYDDANDSNSITAFANFRDALAPLLTIGSSSLIQYSSFSFPPNRYLNVCFKLNLLSGTHTNCSLSDYTINTWIKGAITTRINTVGGPWFSHINIQTDPVGQEINGISKLLLPWGFGANFLWQKTEVNLCKAIFNNGWDFNPGCVYNGLSISTTPGTNVIDNPCLPCVSQNKAAIVFKDCCLDWDAVGVALVNGYIAGVRYAWCGREGCAGGNGSNCGVRTYIAMTAAQYQNVITSGRLPMLCNT